MSASSVTSKVITVVLTALGITSLRNASRDVYLLFLERGVRMYAYGGSTLILALLFKTLDFSDTQLGVFMTLTLLGDVLISLMLTLIADRLGRRKILALGAILMLGSGIVFSFTSNYYILLVAAIVGVISPSGNEIGPFKAVEDSIVAQLALHESRAEIFAVMGLVGSCSTALGQITIGWFSDRMQFSYGWTALATYRCVFLIYSACAVVKLGVNYLLSVECEAEKTEGYAPVSTDEREPAEEPDSALDVDDTAQKEPVQVPQPPIWKRVTALIPSLSHESRSIVWKLCLLFALDSLASGLVPLSFVIYYYHQKFSLEAGSLGPIFFTTSIVAGLSNLVAASVSRTLGLVRTMVFTHLPASIILALIPIPSTAGPAIALLVIRYCTATMDTALKSSLLSQIVLKEERTSVMGIVNVVQTISRSSGPSITGALSGKGIFWISFVAAGTMKASYDLGLLALFYSSRARDLAKERNPAPAGSA